MPFRRQHITAEERVALGCACVLFAGRYGLITDLARTHGVSRRFLCRLRDRGRPAPPGPLTGLADEIYAGRRPALAVVDHASGLVVALEPAGAASETAWGCLLLDLAGRGVRLAGLTADGAHGLAAGARSGGVGEPKADHWHALRDLGRVAKRLEGQAYRALGAAEHAAR